MKDRRQDNREEMGFFIYSVEWMKTYSDAASQKNGLFAARPFSSFSVSVSVALNSNVCLRAGTASRITSRSAVKSAQPCSNNRSASSKT